MTGFSDAVVSEFPDFEILQLSSGTTGYRKVISFKSAALARHVEDFNQTKFSA